MSLMGTFAGIYFRDREDGSIELSQPNNTLIITSDQACVVAGILFGWARTTKREK